jgi:hypothetical protein
MPATAGMQLLHVGERSPKDRNYETSEIVLAAPGTVVAPIPKGMKVNEDNALSLVISQVVKSLNGKGVKKAAFGYIDPDPYATGGFAPIPPAAQTPGVAAPTPSLPQALPSFTGSAGPSTGAQTIGGSITAPFDANALMALMNQYAGTAAGYGLGQDRLAFDRSSFDQNLGFQREQAGISNQFRQQELAMMQQQIGNALQDMTWRYELGLKQLALGERQRLDAWRLGNRGLDIQSADDEFNRIMSGVGEASVAGVRGSGLPSTGIF